MNDWSKNLELTCHRGLETLHFPKPTHDLDWDVPSPKIVNIWDDRIDSVAFWASSDWLQLERWIPQRLWLQTHCGTQYIKNLHGF